jgi:hypothetical protein
MEITGAAAEAEASVGLEIAASFVVEELERAKESAEGLAAPKGARGGRGALAASRRESERRGAAADAAAAAQGEERSISMGKNEKEEEKASKNFSKVEQELKTFSTSKNADADGRRAAPSKKKEREERRRERKSLAPFLFSLSLPHESSLLFETLLIRGVRTGNSRSLF